MDIGLHDVSVKAAIELWFVHSGALGSASVPAAEASRSKDSSSLPESFWSERVPASSSLDSSSRMSGTTCRLRVLLIGLRLQVHYDYIGCKFAVLGKCHGLTFTIQQNYTVISGLSDSVWQFVLFLLLSTALMLLAEWQKVNSEKESQSSIHVGGNNNKAIVDSRLRPQLCWHQGCKWKKSRKLATSWQLAGN